MKQSDDYEFIKVNEPFSPEEKQIHMKLEEIKKAYYLQAQPYVDRLVEIEKCKSPRFLRVPREAIPASKLAQIKELMPEIKKQLKAGAVRSKCDFPEATAKRELDLLDKIGVWENE